MSGSRGDARTRLREAAMGLFRERGFDRVTAAEIAGRAGVTERTFFRHFPDKREVLFDGEAMVSAMLTAAVAEVPPGYGALATLRHAFRSFLPTLEDSWSYSKPRQDIIASTPALHERELTKLDALANALTGALEARGIEHDQAALAARMGLAVFVQAVLSWLADPGRQVGEHLDHGFHRLTVIANEGEGGAVREVTPGLGFRGRS